LVLSAVLAGLLAAHCIVGVLDPHRKPLLPYVPNLGIYGAVFFAYLGVNSLQALQSEYARRRPRYDYDSGDKFPWER
jgi:hypothetical protein